MKEEQTHERLLQALGDMQAQIEGHVRPVAKQVIQAEVERLRNLSEQQKSILNDCLIGIDRTILDCQSQMDEYRQRHSELAVLNERLACLGAETGADARSSPGRDSGGSDSGTRTGIVRGRQDLTLRLSAHNNQFS